MKNPPKFDIKLSFTGNSLKGSEKSKDNSLLLEKLLLNKKINIHLKINLDKLEHHYKSKKLFDSKCQIIGDLEDDNIIKDINREDIEDSKEILTDRRDRIIPKVKLEYSQMNLLRNQNPHKLSRSFSNKKKKISNYKKKILVLDLDETLVYVTDRKENYFGLPQIQFEYYIFDESEKFIKENFNKLGFHSIKKSISYLTIRPGFTKFINEVKKYYGQIIIFTSSQYSYAEEIIKIIDNQKIITKIYSRKDCSFYNDVFYKDLNKITQDLSNIIIIDNYPESYLLQHFNGLPISSFMGDSKDNELLKFIPILEKLSQVKDVRSYIRKITDCSEQKISFNKAYALLNIENKNFFSGNEDYIKSFSYINNNNISVILKNKSSDSKKLKNLTISGKISVDNSKIAESTKIEENDEQILVNDPNNYYYIEKNASSTSGNIKNKKNNNISFLSNNNKIKIKNVKTNRNVISNKIVQNKSQYQAKNIKIPKLQIINTLPKNESNRNIFYNKYKKISKEKNNDSLNCINRKYNLINGNSNVSYFNNQNDSFSSVNSKISSVKHIKIDIINNTNNDKRDISSYFKKKKIDNVPQIKRKKNISCIPEIFEKVNATYYLQGNNKNNENDLNLLENKKTIYSKKYKRIPINKVKNLLLFNNHKNE